MSGGKSARAIADVNGGTILATVTIAASPERVFQALTASDEILKWWGSDQVYRTTEWSADLRVGGAWRAAGKMVDGTPFSVGGEFLEIDAPRTLVQTWKADWDTGVTTLTYRLEPIRKGQGSPFGMKALPVDPIPAVRIPQAGSRFSPGLADLSKARAKLPDHGKGDRNEALYAPGFTQLHGRPDGGDPSRNQP